MSITTPGSWRLVSPPCVWISSGTASQEIIVRHFIIEDFIAIRNGCFVDDKKFDFDFGVSEFITVTQISGTIRDVLAAIDAVEVVLKMTMSTSRQCTLLLALSDATTTSVQIA